MKKTILASATALAALGFWKLYRSKHEIRRVRGILAATDVDNKTFVLRTETGGAVSFHTTPKTVFSWLAVTQGGQNKAEFSDLTVGDSVTVLFKKDVSLTTVFAAERVVLEKVR